MNFYKLMMSAGHFLCGNYYFYPFKKDKDQFLAIIDKSSIFSNDPIHKVCQNRSLEFCKNSFTRNKYDSKKIDACLMLYNLSKGEHIFKNRIDYIKRYRSNIKQNFIDSNMSYCGVLLDNEWIIYRSITTLGIYGIILDSNHILRGIVTVDYSFNYFQFWDIEDIKTLEGYKEGMFDFLINFIDRQLSNECERVLLSEKLSKEDLLKVPNILDMFNQNVNPKTRYNINGFDRRRKNFVTGSFFDVNGFSFCGKHRDTNTDFDLNGMSAYGVFQDEPYKVGFNGYTIRGFNAGYIHKDTGTKFDSNGLNIDGDTEEVAIQKEREKRIKKAKEALARAEVDLEDAKNRKAEALKLLEKESVKV